METSLDLITKEDIDFLTTKPICFEEGNIADYMWGGQKLYELKGINPLASHPIAAESWEISGHAKYPSSVKLPSGAIYTLRSLLENEELSRGILGQLVANRFASDFPALIKFFDCQNYMSVQVHPPDHVAEHWEEDDPGKGEVFVVLDTYEGCESAIYMGLKDGVDKERFVEALNRGENLIPLMHKVEVKTGDVYVLPSGVIHCWSAGTMAVEITEPSDLTYRLYDFGRGRPMHKEKGLASINFDIQSGLYLEKAARCVWKPTHIKGVDFINSHSYLKIERILLDETTQEVEIPNDETFDALMCTHGYVGMSSSMGEWSLDLKKGYSTLIPSKAGNYKIKQLEGNKTELLRIKVDKSHL